MRRATQFFDVAVVCFPSEVVEFLHPEKRPSQNPPGREKELYTARLPPGHDSNCELKHSEVFNTEKNAFSNSQDNYRISRVFLSSSNCFFDLSIASISRFRTAISAPVVSFLRTPSETVRFCFSIITYKHILWSTTIYWTKINWNKTFRIPH